MITYGAQMNVTGRPVCPPEEMLKEKAKHKGPSFFIEISARRKQHNVKVWEAQHT